MPLARSLTPPALDDVEHRGESDRLSMRAAVPVVIGLSLLSWLAVWALVQLVF